MSQDFDYQESYLNEEEANLEIATLYQELLSKSAGARYFRADFHIHTPASKDYREKPYSDDPNDEKRYIDILRKCKEIGLDIIAITDHNTIDGYKKIKSIQQSKSWRSEFSDLFVLLGVEITVEAGRYVHLIAYFDEQTPIQDVENLLIRVGIDNPGDEHDWAKSVKLDQLIKMVTDMGGLAVPAHIDSTAGILEEMKRGLPLARILTMPEIIAVGITKEKTIAYLDELIKRDKNYYRSHKLAYITGSDAHALTRIEAVGKNGQTEVVDRGIGSLTTFIKMDRPCFAGIKYALQDPKTRIRLHPPQVSPHPKIIGIAVTGGYLGAEDDWSFYRFNESLNCIIGGRGTGKSSLLKVLQILSYSLSNLLPENWHEEIKYAFSKACLFVDTGNGCVRAVIARLTPTPKTAVFSMESNGEFTPIDPLDNKEWNPELFGQKQIQAITLSQEAQRSLLDSFCKRVLPKSSTDIFHQLNELKNSLDKLNAIIKDNARAIGDAKHAIFFSNRIIRRLRKLSKGSLADVIADIDDWEAESQIPTFLANLLKEETSNEVKELIAGLKQAKKTLAGMKSSEALKSPDNIFLFLNNLKKLSSLIPLENICLNFRQINSQIIIENLVALKETLSENREFLTKLNDVRSQIYSIRKQVSQTLSEQLNGKITIEVLQMGSNSWLDFIKDTIGISEWNKVADNKEPVVIASIVEQFGTPLLALLDALEKYSPFDDLTKAVSNDASGLLSFAMIKNIKSTFLKRLFESEYNLDDSVTINLVDQNVPRPLEKLSLGQRCVAILDLVLLTDSNVPVLIDQPEDDLDNSYVFSELVTTLLKSKYHRQLIMVTHNPNIPVGGDADQVFIMKSNGINAWIEKSGAVDNILVRQNMLQILEGGRSAFEKRRMRYDSL